MRIRNYGPDNVTSLPVSSNGTALVEGALMLRGITGSQPFGHLRLATGTSATPDIVGVLRQSLIATTFDTDAAGTIFTTRPVQLAYTGRVLRARYATASADLITCTQAVTTTTITVTSLEDDIDTAFLYVVSGTGAGQVNYLTAAASGSATLKAAFATSLDTSSKFIKILPLFHQLGSLNADGTALSSQAAAGAVKISIVRNWFEINGDEVQLNPTKHSALTGLSSLVGTKFGADIIIRDTFSATVD